MDRDEAPDAEDVTMTLRGLLRGMIYGRFLLIGLKRSKSGTLASFKVDSVSSLVPKVSGVAISFTSRRVE